LPALAGDPACPQQPSAENQPFAATRNRAVLAIIEESIGAMADPMTIRCPCLTDAQVAGSSTESAPRPALPDNR
jgi:hypothetical protein